MMRGIPTKLELQQSRDISEYEAAKASWKKASASTTAATETAEEERQFSVSSSAVEDKRAAAKSRLGFK